MTLDLDKLEADAQRATKGPWEQRRREGYFMDIDGANGWAAFAQVVIRMRDEQTDCAEGVANATHIANCSPDTILELVRLARGAEGLVGKWEREADHGHNDYTHGVADGMKICVSDLRRVLRADELAAVIGRDE